MTGTNKAMSAAMLALAESASDPQERLDYLKSAIRIDPQNLVIAEEIQVLETQTGQGLRYVAIESAIHIGPTQNDIRGQIFIVQSDQSLKLLSGDELSAFNDQYPDFIKNWQLEKD